MPSGFRQTGPLYQTNGRVRRTITMSADVVSSLRRIVCRSLFLCGSEREKWKRKKKNGMSEIGYV